MELLLNDEQKILRDSAARFAERKAGPKAARVQRTMETGYDRAIMGEAAESGWLGILVPEGAGGLGLGLTELALVLEQAGRGLVTAPVLATAVSARAVAEGDSADLRDNILPGLIAGKSIVLVIDQFEELFRYATTVSGKVGLTGEEVRARDEATQFVQLLLEASRAPSIRIHVILTMRSDFIGDCARFHGLPEAVCAAQFLVPSLTRDARLTK